METTRIKKIFIANRGEIALRVIRAARKMNINTVVAAIVSEKDQPFVREADEYVVFNSMNLSETYLNPDILLRIAMDYGCDAVHPGYGFLSENATFARKVSENGLIWIGPSPASIQLMGNKVKAGSYARQQGLPVIQSWKGEIDKLKKEKNKFPYPVLIKASAGGGGKGMKLVHSANNFDEAIMASSRETLAYFGDAEVYVEQYIQHPRHIEVQVFGDKHGNYVHLFERDCSIQRRHQKIIEEAGDINLSGNLRAIITDVSVKLTRALQYVGAGTIEYLVDDRGKFYFLEMNTRIQVEHPVTEEVTGIDLVAEQIRVAEGHPLSFNQQDVILSGHAIECRIYAEDPQHNFMPAPGKVELNKTWNTTTARIETGYGDSFDVLPDFDPMISKVITTGRSRRKAIKAMQETLSQYYLQGIRTNIPYLQSILSSEDFLHQNISTTFCEEVHTDLIDKINNNEADGVFPAAVMALIKHYTQKKSVGPSPDAIGTWESLGNWRMLKDTLVEVSGNRYFFSNVKINNQSIEFYLDLAHHQVSFSLNRNQTCTIFLMDKPYTGYVNHSFGDETMVSLNGFTYAIDFVYQLKSKSLKEYRLEKISGGTKNGFVYSPLNGKALKIHVNHGDKVLRGDVLLIIESMKTENKILAEHDGTISNLEVKEGDVVIGKQLLMQLT